MDNSWITLLGVSTMAWAKGCRRFSWAGLESAPLVEPFEFVRGPLGLGRCRRLGPHKNQAKLADLNFVATDQHSRLHRLPVDVGAVEATHVDNVEFVVLASKFGVPAAHRDVIEKDITAGMSARRRDRPIQQEARSGVRTPFHHQQCRTRRQPLNPGGAAIGTHRRLRVEFVEEVGAGAMPKWFPR